MSQTRTGSLIEAIINVLIGFWINFAANLLILPMIGFHITLGQNFFIGLLYTIISIARSYCIRRWFNYYIVKAAQKLSAQIESPHPSTDKSDQQIAP
jgi:hypothetical protein